MTESAAYTYDNLGRLVTSNQTSNGSSAQRRFAYDRWGNRTGMWDATSGGNQIQAITLQQLGGAPTNRIATVTAGSTVNYLYDPAGNVINDGIHTYGYDGENRLVSVDGGATASYAYDQQNRRYKKTVGSSATHYVWQGSHPLSEYDGTTGAVIYNYVYSGSRLIARMGSGVINWYLSDRLSTRLVLDASGNVIGRQGHLAYGEDFGESGIQERHHFTSYEQDSECGLNYAVNRNYNQTSGSFIQVDPYQPGCSNLQMNLNRYVYGDNDPINRTDPLGLIPPEDFLCIINPILCERNRLPGGSPGPESEGRWDLGFHFGWGLTTCRCSGTTACGVYERLCRDAKERKLNQAAIDYYCEAAPRVCNGTPKTGFGSCTANCIRKCLQNWENTNTCFLAGAFVDTDKFIACEAAIHVDCYASCSLCAFL